MNPRDVLVTIEHPFGTIEVPLEEWIKTGPGPRDLLQPSSARSEKTGERLPLTVVPLRYRNNTLSRLLIRLGVLDNPWPDNAKPMP